MNPRIKMLCLFLFLLSTTACIRRGSVPPTLASPVLATFTVSPPTSSSATPVPALTPTLSPTPDFCSPVQWQDEIFVLSTDLFDALRPGGPRTFDRILVAQNSAWADFRQEVRGEVRTAGVIFHEIAAGTEWGTGVNPAVILVTYGVAYDWALPPDGDLAFQVEQIRAQLDMFWSEWVHSQPIQTQHPIANGTTYALYRYFDGDLQKLETWCRTYVDVYSESPNAGRVVRPTSFAP